MSKFICISLTFLLSACFGNKIVSLIVFNCRSHDNYGICNEKNLSYAGEFNVSLSADKKNILIKRNTDLENSFNDWEIVKGNCVIQSEENWHCIEKTVSTETTVRAWMNNGQYHLRANFNGTIIREEVGISGYKYLLLRLKKNKSLTPEEAGIENFVNL
jgi:hypothetical protein